MEKKYLRKRISIIILSILFFVLSILIVKIVSIKNKESCDFFLFDIKLYKNDTINIRQSIDKPFIIYFADPECDICEHEIILLSKKIKHILKKHNLLFVTIGENSKMVSFLTKLDIYPNIGVFIGKDEYFKIYDYYRINSIPTILILDKNFVIQKRTSSIKLLLNTL